MGIERDELRVKLEASLLLAMSTVRQLEEALKDYNNEVPKYIDDDRDIIPFRPVDRQHGTGTGEQGDNMSHPTGQYGEPPNNHYQ